MRKALLLVTSILALAAGAVALAAVTRTVAIKPTGFSPVTRTIQTGDSIRWRNDDTVNHQVVADNGHFASPVLRPKQTYTRLFNTSGTFRYRDALEPAERGTIVVQGPAVGLDCGVTGHRVLRRGNPADRIHLVRATNQLVEIWSKPYGQSSPVKVADLRTVTGGGWDFPTIPKTLTEYYARWGSRQSVTVAVGVRPRTRSTAGRRTSPSRPGRRRRWPGAGSTSSGVRRSPSG